MSTDSDSVLQAAVRLLVRRPAASMDEIARAAGISRATLHRMFPGRPVLIRALGLHAIDLLRKALDDADLEDGPGDAGEALRRLTGTLMPVAAFLSFLYGEGSLVEEPEVVRAWAEMDDRVTTRVRRGQEDGTLRVDLTAQWISEALFSVVAGAGWAVHDGRLAARDATRSVTELLLGGALRPDGR